MKPLYYYQPLLLLAAAFVTACSSSSDDFLVEQPPQPSTELTWTAYGYGEKDSIDGVTRALFFGGNGGGRCYNLWDVGDQVKVYKDGVYKGYQTPTTYGRVNTELAGTLTGTFAVNDALKMYVLGPDMDFTGQNGKIGKMSDTFTYQVAEDAVVETVDAEGQILTFSGGSFKNQQAFFRFMLTDESGNRLHISQLEISTDANKLVQIKALGGDAVYGNLVVTATQEDNEYPADMFVAVRTENDAADTWHFKAYVGEDVYYGPSNTALSYKPTNGRLANIVRQMKLTTAASTLTIADIADKTFTGSAIEPTELTVKDGETTLTVGTDYAIDSYSDNTDVGTATVTITGLADAGATAATKYLGTKSKTFNIVEATPIIVMESTAMTLVNNATQNSGTRTVTRVFVDNNGNGTWDEGTDYDITALCTVTYASASDAVATVNASSGVVTAAGPGTTTITATVASATNWTTQTASYTVNVEQEVNGENAVTDWTNQGTSGGKVYAE